jgi:hypothetical protein
MSWIPNVGDRAFHKQHGAFTVTRRLKKNGEVVLMGLPNNTPAMLADCSPDRSESALNESEIETLTAVAIAILESVSVEDMDLLTHLTPAQKLQVWEALTPQQRLGLTRLRERKAA